MHDDDTNDQTEPQGLSDLMAKTRGLVETAHAEIREAKLRFVARTLPEDEKLLVKAFGPEYVLAFLFAVASEAAVNEHWLRENLPGMPTGLSAAYIESLLEHDPESGPSDTVVEDIARVRRLLELH